MASHRDSAPARCEPIKRTGLVTHDHEKGAYAVEASTGPSAPAPTGSRGWTSAPAISGTYPRTSTTASAVTKTPSRSTKKAARQTRLISRSEAEVIAALSRDTDWSALVTGAASRTNAASPEATRPAARHASPSARTRSQGRSLL